MPLIPKKIMQKCPKCGICREFDPYGDVLFLAGFEIRCPKCSNKMRKITVSKGPMDIIRDLIG